MRRVGTPPIPGRRYRLRPGAYAILARDGWLLLTHQALPVPEIHLPGGGIDPGEPPLAALRREVREETGWAMGAPRRLGSYRRFAYLPEYDQHFEKVCHVFTARPVRSLGPPTEPGHTAFWARTDTALKLLEDPGQRLILRRFSRSAIPDRRIRT